MIEYTGTQMSVVIYRGVEQLVARRAHNPEVAGSSPVPATREKENTFLMNGVFLLLAMTGLKP